MADVKAADSGLGRILLFCGMLGGNAILAIAASLSSHTQTPVSLSLAICGLVCMSINAARYIDVPGCGGQTDDCDSVGLRHWKRPLMTMPPVSVPLPVGVLVKNPG
jgi:hypothetical protein